MAGLSVLPAEPIEQAPATEELQPEAPQASEDPAAGNEELQECIKALVKHFIGLDKWVERQEVIDARLQRFYWRDVQYIFWKSDAVGFTHAVGGVSVDTSEGGITIPRYTDVYNIYTPYGESLISVLIQNVPGVNWQPVDMSEGRDLTAAQAAEKYQQKLDQDVNRKELQAAAARLMYTDGRTTFLTEQMPDGSQRITAHGVLETKPVPIMAKSREELIAYFISDELDVYKAKDEYSEFRDKVRENSGSPLGESPYRRIARLGVLQGTKAVMQAGDAFSHMITRHRVFLRPSCFEKADPKFWEELKTSYSEGIFVTFCGDAYCGSKNASMDSHIVIDFPSPGDGMNRSSMGKRVVPLQDTFNDELNLWHEAHDFCVPTLFMYTETGDIDAIREQISEPGNIVPFSALPPGATSAAEAFYAAVLEGIPPTLPQLIQFIQGPLSQFISGAFPALFGGDTKDNDTAKGIAIQRDQAMGRLGIPWGAIQRLFAGAYTQAVELAKSSPMSKFNYSSKDRGGNAINEEVSMDDLRGGSARCYADVDVSFPESNTSKRQTFQLLMAAAERNPLLAETIAQPDNQEFAHEILGLPDLVVPAALARNKQFTEIDELLKEEPIPPSMEEIQQAAIANPQLLQAMATWEQQAMAIKAQTLPGFVPGIPPMPIPPEMYRPSIDIDPIFDFHQYEAQTVKDWLSSPQRREIERTNPKGVMNVRLHGLRHQMMIPPPVPAEQPQAPNHKTGPNQASEKLKEKTGNQPAQPAPQEKLA